MKIAQILAILTLISLQGQGCFALEEISDSTISVSYTNKNFEDCLIDISNRSGLYMAYKTSLIDTIFVQSFHCRNCNLDDLLDSFFNKYGIAYEYRNRQVFLRKKPDINILKGRIFNASDSLAIPYASISLHGTPLGTICDFKGVYEWELSSQYMNDTAIISSLGFERKRVSMQDLISETSVRLFLTPAFMEIDAVEIHPRAYLNKTLGNNSKRSAGSIYIDTHGQQTGLLIRNDKGANGLLKSVSYYLSSEGNTNAPYRIRIYAVDSLKRIPAGDIINEILVAKPLGGEGWHTSNLSSYNIEFGEHGIFVALEGIFPNDYEYYAGDEDFIDIRDKSIETPIIEDQPTSISYGQRLGYNRKQPENTWHYSLSHTWFQLRKQQYGVMIQATVRFEKEKKKRKGRKNE